VKTRTKKKVHWLSGPFHAAMIASAFNGAEWEPLRWQWTCLASSKPDREQRRAFEEAQIGAATVKIPVRMQ
jgi:hypothetical protein